MNFLRLPFLVQKETLLNFSNTEKVLLSLCSTKSAQIIRNLRLNIKKVQFTFGSANDDEPPNAKLPNLTIQILDKNDKEEDVLVFLEYVYPQFPDHGTMLLTIGGMNIRFRYPETHSTNPRSHLQYLTIAEDRLITSIQDHMNFIFPRQHDKQLVMRSSNCFETFKKFTNLHEISLEWGKASVETLEMLMTNHPELKGLQLEFDERTFVIQEDSPLLSLEKLNLLTSNPKTTETCLENFKGRYLWLNWIGVCDTKLFMDFVKKWISGDGFDNIKGVEVFAGGFQRFDMWTDPGSFARRNGGKAWDAERRPRNFVMKERMINPCLEYQWEPVQSIFMNEPIDCGHFFDVQRNDGKKLASFFISCLEFKFLVWDDHEWNRI